jgi:hypothetical protein
MPAGDAALFFLFGVVFLFTMSYAYDVNRVRYYSLLKRTGVQRIRSESSY